MGREEQLLKGAGRCVKAAVVVVTFVVCLCVPVGQAMGQTYGMICRTHEKSFELYPHKKVFLGTNDSKFTVRVKADGCVKDKRVLDVSALTATNTSLTKTNLKWFEVFFISCERFVVKIGDEVVKFNYENISPECVNGPVKLSVESGVHLANKCIPTSWMEKKDQTESKAACEELKTSGVVGQSHGNADTLSGLKTDFSYLDYLHYPRSNTPLSINQEELNAAIRDDNDDSPALSFGHSLYSKDPLLDTRNFEYPKLPDIDVVATTRSYDFGSNNYLEYNKYSGRRTYKNAIPIFIGLVAFTITMSLRFCLCRGKTVVRRVTTVTVISRGRSPEALQDCPDPPPSYIDVVNETPHTDTNEDTTEPPPPAYADIVNEVQPPTYSEVETQSPPTSDEVPLTEHETQDSTAQQPTDHEAAADDRGPAPPQNILSKFRSQQKQFAFKMLEENE